MHATDSLPTTQNDAWGFWGTMQDQAQESWPIALTAISHATGQPLESVRIFLDSRHGRHFADDVRNNLHIGSSLHEAVNAAIQRWMDWTIGRQTSKQYGIPKGLPYLTGFVMHGEIIEDAWTD